MQTYSSELVKDLLTENRFLTFWKMDWSDCVYVFWGGKTPKSKVIAAAKKHLKTTNVMYERQVQLKEPELTFA